MIPHRIKDHRQPKTTIAVLGATGAGKSALLNALLEGETLLSPLIPKSDLSIFGLDEIVPVSGMEGACTGQNSALK